MRGNAIGRGTPRGRGVLFAALAGACGLAHFVLLDALGEGLMPWAILGCPGCDPGSHPEIHRWHGAIHAASVGLLLGGSMLAMLWRPRAKPLLLQFYTAGHVLLLTVYLAFAYQPFSRARLVQMLAVTAAFLSANAVLVAVNGAPRELLRFGAPSGRSRPLAALALASGALLAPWAWSCLMLQLRYADESAVFNRWNECVITSVLLVIAGWMASSKRGGWKELGVLTGLAYLYLGAAALAVPNQPGSWGVTGGIFSVAGGMAYLWITAAEARAEAEPAEVQASLVSPSAIRS